MSCSRGPARSQAVADALGCPALEPAWNRARQQPTMAAAVYSLPYHRQRILSCGHKMVSEIGTGGEEWCAECDDWRQVTEAIDLHRANLDGANLSGVDLRQVDMSEASAQKVNLSRADLRGVNLAGANLRGANLLLADLRGANLGGADLRDARLSRANLSGANLSGADLRGATYSAKTRWPDGFDPTSAMAG